MVKHMIKYSKLLPLVRAIENADAPHLAAQRVLLPLPRDSAEEADAKAREYLDALLAVPPEHWPPALAGVRATAEFLASRDDD